MESRQVNGIVSDYFARIILMLCDNWTDEVLGAERCESMLITIRLHGGTLIYRKEISTLYIINLCMDYCNRTKIKRIVHAI